MKQKYFVTVLYIGWCQSHRILPFMWDSEQCHVCSRTRETIILYRLDQHLDESWNKSLCRAEVEQMVRCAVAGHVVHWFLPHASRLHLLKPGSGDACWKSDLAEGWRNHVAGDDGPPHLGGLRSPYHRMFTHLWIAESPGRAPRCQLFSTPLERRPPADIMWPEEPTKKATITSSRRRLVLHARPRATSCSLRLCKSIDNFRGKRNILPVSQSWSEGRAKLWRMKSV